MRLIVEAFGRAWALSLVHAKTGEDCEVSSQPDFEASPPHDPHGTGGGQFERRSDLEDLTARRFGFHGRKE